MRIYSEESFGPVVSVVRVSGDEEALRVANDTEYGLSAAVFRRDIARARKLASRVCRAAFATSMGLRCTMRRRCRLEA
jgi:acyl-CoA reductase-like NAD-dependent aldehyde dehydrogenase